MQNTPDPHDIITPEATLTNNENDNRNNKEKPTPKTKSQLRQEYKTYKAKKLTTQLQATNFCDVGNLSNVMNDERVTIIALAMYNRLGLFDPSNEFVRNYKHKDMLEKYKNISEERPTKVNALLQLHDIMQTTEIRIDQLKTKTKTKNNNKNTNN